MKLVASIHENVSGASIKKIEEDLCYQESVIHI
jgi:hypothetical protein